MTTKTHQAGVKADTAKNRLYITITGRLSKRELDKLYTDVRFCVADLDPGFDVVNDLSRCTLAALSGIPTYKKIINHLISHRVRRVIRIIDDSKIIFKQILTAAANLQGYRATYVRTLEEAEAELDRPERRQDLRFHLHNQHISYASETIKGQGKLFDISTSGCMLETITEPPPVNSMLSLSTAFCPHKELLNSFEVQGRVVWVKSASFAVEYAPLSPEYKEKLWQRLVHESHKG